MTPELEAKQEYEERIRDLLKAYQETLETVEDLPVVVSGCYWIGRFLEAIAGFPICDGFSKYFVVHHIEIGA